MKVVIVSGPWPHPCNFRIIKQNKQRCWGKRFEKIDESFCCGSVVIFILIYTSDMFPVLAQWPYIDIKTGSMGFMVIDGSATSGTDITDAETTGIHCLPFTFDCKY